MHGKDMEESKCYYKEQFLKHGAYLFFNTATSNVCASGVSNNGFELDRTPWSNIDVIACCQFGKRHGSLLMKHMVDASDGHSFFIYAVTDRK